MNNIVYNRQAKACATPIVNALYNCYSEASKFFICMLNNQTQTYTPAVQSKGGIIPGKPQTNSYFRKDYNGAHFIVKYHGNDKDFIDSYYMTFNCCHTQIANQITFTIRKDFIDFIKTQDDIDDMYFLAVAKFDEKIFRVPVKKVISNLNNKSAVSLNEKTEYPCYIIATSIAEELAWDDSYQQFKASKYEYKYFKPEMIGNFVYSSFRKGIKVRLVTWNAKGKKCDDIICRSIGEAYDKLTTAGVITIGKRGFAKAIAERKSITYELENSTFMRVFVTLEIDAQIGDIDPFVRLEDKEAISPLSGEVETQQSLVVDLGETTVDDETQQTIKTTDINKFDCKVHSLCELYNEQYHENRPNFDDEINNIWHSITTGRLTMEDNILDLAIF